LGEMKDFVGKQNEKFISTTRIEPPNLQFQSKRAKYLSCFCIWVCQIFYGRLGRLIKGVATWLLVDAIFSVVNIEF